jgi:DNA-binding SARP family transcriptional activator
MDVQLLGAVEIWAGGVVVNAGPPQQRLVLAALAVDAGRPVTPETLIDRVWDRAPAGSRRTLHVLVCRLRKVLQETAAGDQPLLVLDNHGGGYRLGISDDNVDAHRFHRLVRQARTPQLGGVERVELLRQALALWQGEPLLGLPGQWAEQTRTTWHKLHLEALIAWAQAEIEVGDPVAVIASLTGLTATYPLAEPLAGALMQAMHAAGRSAEAIDVYTALRHRLADELGTDPGPGLHAVYLAILRHDPASDGVPRLAGQGATVAQGAEPGTASSTNGEGRAASMIDGMLPGEAFMDRFRAVMAGDGQFDGDGAFASVGRPRYVVGVVPNPAGAFQHRQVADDVYAALAGVGTVILSGESARAQILSGLGGVGKTQLAADVARRLRGSEAVQALFWVTAADRSAIVAGFAAAAEEVGAATGVSDADAAARAFRQWLSRTSVRWLLVLDDLANPADLHELWPPELSTGRTVITTRRRDASLRTHGALIPVGVFTSTCLLTSQSPGSSSRGLADVGSSDCQVQPSAAAAMFSESASSSATS